MNRLLKKALIQLWLTLCLCGFAQATLAFEMEGGGMKPLTLRLEMAQQTPFRIGYLMDPLRVVVDVQTDQMPVPPGANLPRDVTDLRTGQAGPGWSRIVIETRKPHRLIRTEAEGVGTDTTLRLVFAHTGLADFADLSARLAPRSFASGAAPVRQASKDRAVVVIDPGHGGIDPGAVRDGIAEKDLALIFAHRLKDALLWSDKYDIILTRNDDSFLTLRQRTRIARVARADLFLSIHANTVLRGDASGSTVYLLSDVATDAHAKALAERENRSDMIAGLDLSGQSDALTDAILDLSQAQTNANSRAFGDVLVSELRASTGVIRAAPLRGANFMVLRAPEVPSALLELGFLSNTQDLALMQNPIWQKFAAQATARAIETWLDGANREQNPSFLQTVSGK